MRRILAWACAVPLAPAQSGAPEKTCLGAWLLLSAASTLPEPDRWWFPENRPELRQQDIETVYLEITSHQPVGAVPHEWK